MKKTISLFLILSLAALVIAGCGEPGSSQNENNQSIDNQEADLNQLMSLYKNHKAVAGAGPQHGNALVGSLKYPPDFKHLDYVNPDAPKGGTLSYGSSGSFDSMNPFILKGNPAPGISFLFDTLMTSVDDEPSSQYGLIAESLEVPSDSSSVTFTLRKEARFHDRAPVTPEDVIYSFTILTTEAHPFYQQYWAGVKSVEKTGDDKVTFNFVEGSNPELPHILGQLNVLSKKYYETHTFNAATEEPPMGSGPYMVEDVKFGKSITYKLDPDYWAKDLPIMKGRYNFEKVRLITYLDENVRFQGFKGGETDFFVENISKRWATEYTGPDFDKGILKTELVPDQNPKGLQGFAFNTRKTIFQDRKVREAISYAFDFEWSNKNLFYGQYTRTRSYFENSVFASYLGGLPGKTELELLEPLRDQIPEEVFTKIYEPPKSDGSGNIRENLQTGINLLEEAGWVIEDTELVNEKTGEKFTFEILLDTPSWERICAPFVKNLEQMGIKATYRVVDIPQYEKRIEKFDFDMAVMVWAQSFSPGNEQRNMWSTEAADRPGSSNLAGIKNPAVDSLINSIISAEGIENLTAATRALDRVLLWNFYSIPQHYIKYFRIAYWDKFGRPETRPPFNIPFFDTWWIDPEKEKALESKK
ncbi:MAG: ABC transporter substrate-binding protein [Spirochaetales bacterium]|nr:ABC transporter substrate-binding protein [Spirochaetales bacterium]